jgi:regulator of PEP synthase PpsR (kinase-PPPase family)
MFHIYAVSDATGTTAERVVRAAIVQFDDHRIEITRHGGVRDIVQIREIVNKASLTGGFVVHTFVYEELRHVMLTEGRSHNVTTIDLMGPLLARLSESLAMQPRAEPGIFQPFDSAYIERIEAINFTVRHDDGKNIDDLDQADIIIVGVSRTSKTPLSIYLAYRGWKVANIPIILGVDPPDMLFKLPRKRVVGLIIKPERLTLLRQARLAKMGTHALGYADLEHIRKEVAFSYQVFERRRDWPLVDVSSKPIEETASEVVTLVTSSEYKPNEFSLE